MDVWRAAGDVVVVESGRWGASEEFDGAAVAAFGGQGGGEKVAGAGQADEGFGGGAVRAGPAPHLGEDVSGRGAGGVEALIDGGAGDPVSTDDIDLPTRQVDNLI